MKERLIQLLDLEQLSPSKFADIIGVQRSSISHVLSGRNKPSFDFLQKTLKAFPGLNASWLMLGEGTMYEQMGRKVSGNLFDAQENDEGSAQDDILDSARTDVRISSSEEPVHASTEQAPMPEDVESLEDTAKKLQGEPETKSTESEKKRIVQVMVIYEDDTFKTFMPAH
jgi:transcriptional regulator with XRE-family HTH domain